MRLLIMTLALTMCACGTTFTAKQGQTTFMSLKTSAPGKVQVKIDTKVACTVNAVGPINLTMSCPAGMVPWYDGLVPTCISNPCPQGTLTHNPDGTVGCK